MRFAACLIVLLGWIAVPSASPASPVALVSGAGEVSTVLDDTQLRLGAGVSAVGLTSATGRAGQLGIGGFTTRNNLNPAIQANDYFELSISNARALELLTLSLTLDRGPSNAPARRFNLLVDVGRTGVFAAVAPELNADGVTTPGIVWDLTGLGTVSVADFRIYGYAGSSTQLIETSAIALEGAGDPVTGAALTLEAAVVPLPAALALLLTGLAGFALIRARGAAT